MESKKGHVYVLIKPWNMKSPIKMKKLQMKEIYNEYFEQDDIKYVVSRKTKILHDKECYYAKKIKKGNASFLKKLYPKEDVRYCKVCYRKVIIHTGITDMLDYDMYDRFFEENKIDSETLFKLFVLCEAKASINGDYINITCYEDKWRLSLKSKEGKVELQHNNYIKNFLGERYISKGFHRQKLSKQTVLCALECIMKYDYQKYFNGKGAMYHGLEWRWKGRP